MKRLDSERFLIEKDSSVIVTIRLKSSTVNKYDKLTALVNTLDPDLKATRTAIMRLVLERAVNQLLRDPRVVLILLRNSR
jgi:DNA-binding MurR/RpiR family transcriptional regulator